MSSPQKGLGRGLDALFSGSQAQMTKNPETALVAVESLFPNPHQPRRTFDADSLQELADSIKSQGIIQPLLVRPTEDGQGYQIVAGERRWRAAQLAGLGQVPVYVRELSDKEVMAAALIENLQREDLNPIEEAQALQSLRDALELTQEELATRLGKSRPAVANALRLLQLSAAAQEDLRTGRLSAGHARCLLAVDTANAADHLRKRIIEADLTVRQCEEAASHWRNHGCMPWDAGNAQASDTVGTQPQLKNLRKKEPSIRLLQTQLTEKLGCKAGVSGTEQAGKITLSYTSSEELKALLEHFGMKMPQPN